MAPFVLFLSAVYFVNFARGSPRASLYLNILIHK